MTSLEIAAKIKTVLIPEDFGMSFEELKHEIFKNYKKSSCGASDHFKGKQGYEVFYTDNKNFMNGIKNGGGSGYFARTRQVGFYSTVKLESA